MPVPIIERIDRNGLVTEKPDKQKYLLENSRLRKTKLVERVRVRMLRELCQTDGVKYIFTVLPRQAADALHHRRVDFIFQGFKDTFAPLSCPTRDDIEAYFKGTAMSLFELARLHEALTSEALSPVLKHTLAEYGLALGIPDRSVVPALRVFDRDRFSEALEVNAISLAEFSVRFAKLVKSTEPASVQSDLVELQKGYKWRTKVDEKKKENRGLYRISTMYATLLHKALEDNAAIVGKHVPELNEIFSDDLNRYPLGTRLGTSPRKRVEGKIV